MKIISSIIACLATSGILLSGSVFADSDQQYIPETMTYGDYLYIIEKFGKDTPEQAAAQKFLNNLTSELYNKSLDWNDYENHLATVIKKEISNPTIGLFDNVWLPAFKDKTAKQIVQLITENKEFLALNVQDFINDELSFSSGPNYDKLQNIYAILNELSSLYDNRNEVFGKIYGNQSKYYSLLYTKELFSKVQISIKYVEQSDKVVMSITNNIPNLSVIGFTGDILYSSDKNIVSNKSTLNDFYFDSKINPNFSYKQSFECGSKCESAILENKNTKIEVKIDELYLADGTNVYTLFPKDLEKLKTFDEYKVQLENLNLEIKSKERNLMDTIDQKVANN